MASKFSSENVLYQEKSHDSSVPSPSAERDDDSIEKKLVRKCDRRILPWLFGLWLLAFIDRANIGNAKIVGLTAELGLVGKRAVDFNLALLVFYIPYICVDIPSNLIVKAVGAGYYLPGLLLAWGIVSFCTGFVRDLGGLIAVRVFLGLAEGGLLGGLIIYLALFYRRHELLRRITYFYCAAPLSGAFGGLLATGLSRISTPGYSGWRFIFLVEGAITIVFGMIAICFLPHTPAHARFLTPDEKSLAIDRMQRDVSGAASTSTTVDEEKFSWHWVKLALANWNTILLSLNFFAIITPIYSFSLFLPTITRSFGYDMVTAQLLTVPPNMLAFFTVLITGWLSDKIRMRGPLMIVGTVVAAVGYILLLAGNNVGVRYAGTFLVGAGIFPCSPLVMGWLANNLAPHYVRATGTGTQIMIANFAAFIATFTYVDSDAPRYITGHAINLGMLGLSIILSVILIVYQKRENKVRDRGGRDDRLGGDESLLGCRHPRFRYVI